MPDMLSNGISALLGFQTALTTTSHNIANVNTEGYSRQRVVFAARVPQNYGPYYIGAGASIDSVSRLYDQYITTQLQSATAGQSRLSTYTDLATRLDDLLGDKKAGLQPALDGFFNAAQDVANDPASTSGRQVLLGQATALTARFHSIANRINQLDQETNQRINDKVSEINSLGNSIAQLNDQIQRTNVVGGGSPNDLLDKRDELVRQLSTKVGVTVVPQDGNVINIFVGSGQTLVLGNQSKSLGVAANAYDASRKEVTSGGVNVTNQLTGGELGGLVDFRRDIIDSSRNGLGRTAVALANAFNAQHRAGQDLQGQLGGDFFSVSGPQVLPNLNNGGTGVVSAVTVSNLSKLTTADYTVRYNGASWSATRSDGSVATLTGTGAPGNPFVADGISFQVSGAPNAGDSFLIRPIAVGASSLALNISDPTQIAAASPIRSTKANNNTGNVAISPGTVLDVTNPNLRTPVAISFTSPTTYQINGAGAFAYTSGAPITLNGWSVTLTGTPQLGDSFSIGPNTGGVGDNTNALKLAQLTDKGLLDSGNSTLNNAYSQLVAQVGITTEQAKVGLDAQTALLNEAQQTQQGVSGVNLDEEATNLVRFQQSYQAAAKIITAANTIFDSLLAAVRG